MKEKKRRENRPHRLSIRLTDSEYAPFRKAMELTNTPASEYLRLHLTGKLTPIMPSEVNKKEIKELIRLFNKTSNNINQIAKRFNTLAKEGTITSRQAMLALNTLNRISDNLLIGIENVSQD